MASLHWRIRRLMATCTFILGWLSLGPLSAQITITALTAPYTAPGYVIQSDSDPITGRQRIRPSADLNVTTAGNYLLRWSLIDGTGAVSNIRTEGPVALAVGVVTRDGFVTPAVAQRLDAGKRYRARLEVLNSTGTTLFD
jgi:hypothetical protein